jgi:hypothetical protein
MRKIITATFLIFFSILVHFTACKCSIEKDARQLAAIQHERTALIIIMLKTTDSTTLNHHKQNLQIIENRFTTLKKTYDTKYSEPRAKASFETAYAKALEERRIER